MSKSVNTAVLDLALNDIKTNGNKMTVCGTVDIPAWKWEINLPT
jgi:hypothetical protein